MLPSIRLREIALVSAILSVMILLQVFATRSGNLFGHVLWLDETLTWTIANDPSFAHAMAAVRGGVETNPPTMYLILWPIARVLGGLNEVGLRVFSFASIVTALAGIYTICGHRFGPIESFVGALVLAAHPLIVFHAFEARFYGPWLAATVWYVVMIMRLRDSKSRSLGSMIVACALAILAATMHYFGVVAVLLISTADVVFDSRPPGPRGRRLIPPACGLAAALLCIPFILGQRAGLHVRTWIEPSSLSEVKDVLVALFGPPSLLVILLATWACIILRGAPDDANDASEQSPPDLRVLIPLGSLLLFPLLIIAFAFLVQPALKDRYLILAVAPLAPLAAHLASRTPRWFALGLILLLFVIGAAEMMGRSRAVRGLQRDTRAMIDDVRRQLAAGEPVMFKRRVEIFPLARAAPDLLPQTSLLDFDPSLDSNVRAFSVYERDMARTFARFYDRYKLAPLNELPRRFVLVVPPDPREQDDARAMFPEARFQQRGTWTWLISQ